MAENDNSDVKLLPFEKERLEYVAPREAVGARR